MKNKNTILVTSQSFDSRTGFATAPAREEVIDLGNNRLFQSCSSLLDVKDVYEGFWNHMSAQPLTEMVIVQKLEWK
jgi:hypothetical protein